MIKLRIWVDVELEVLKGDFTDAEIVEIASAAAADCSDVLTPPKMDYKLRYLDRGAQRVHESYEDIV